MAKGKAKAKAENASPAPAALVSTSRKRKRDSDSSEPKAGPGPNSKKRKSKPFVKDADIDALAPAARTSSTLDPYSRAVVARYQMSCAGGAIIAIDFEGLKFANDGPKLVAEVRRAACD